MSTVKDTNPLVLLLSKEDNVLVARKLMYAGQKIQFDDKVLILDSDADVGFKIARYDIRNGEKVIKYGASIGSATANIIGGQVVHIHNMKSDYIPTYIADAD